VTALEHEDQQRERTGFVPLRPEQPLDFGKWKGFTLPRERP
jgi:hypothetical protein